MQEENISPYQLRTNFYSGPLEKLLELIQERHLEITQISLAQITQDFLSYVAQLSTGAHGSIRVLVDFVAVGSRLILIKSKSLIPQLQLTVEEEQDIAQLEERLKLYREFKPAFRLLRSLYTATPRQYARPYLLQRPRAQGFAATTEQIPMFFPGPSLNAQLLQQAYAGIVRHMQQEYEEEELVRESVVSLEQEMQAVITRLQSFETLTFSQLSSQRSRRERIVAFLAILHLAREQLVALHQVDAHSDIMIHVQPVSNAL